MDDRYKYADPKVEDRNARILEIGPLNRPIFTKDQYPNCFYCDIRTTEAIKALYSGNAYLETTGISIAIDTIVDIDFVLRKNYSNTFENIEKFDFVIMSHVIEHVDDILYFFDDILSALKPGGSLIIVYPDKRYCFDHYRQEASFRDAFEVSQEGYKANGRMVFDFLFNAIQENSEPFFWQAYQMENHMPVNSFEAAKAAYNRIMDGLHEDDVHYWPFSDIGFLKFLYDCTRAGLLKFTCTDFVPTAENTQQFFVTLRYDETVPENIERELVNLRSMVAKAPIDYRNSGQLRIEEQYNFLIKEREALQSQAKAAISQNEELLRQVEELQTSIEAKNQQYIESQSQILTVEEYSRQLESDLGMQRKRAETNAKIVDELKAQIAMILTSSSWKITAPARRLVDIIRKR
ncbi:methyltransferase domain-containing protein [Lacrimispora sp.]|uniref:methyltransferase domain-containing protein n=1 Tax=Lacrimispora sp. TaxID=2719234 RepID=UPI0028AFB225|nr:methyltransferase domain-containing protein [Lacrimispora sp.]